MFRKHYSDEQLLAFLDGELESKAARALEQHLETCWSCRGRQQELEAAAQRLAHAMDRLEYPGPGWLAEAQTRLDAAIGSFERSMQPAPPAIRWWRWVLVPAACVVAAATVFVVSRPAAPKPTMPAPPKTSVSAPVTLPGKATPDMEGEPSRTPLSSLVPDSLKRRPTESELLEAETDAAYALHRLRACLGEPIGVHRDPSGYVLVKGVVDTPERKVELEQELAGAARRDLIRVDIKTVAEAVENSEPPTSSGASAPPVLQAERPADRDTRRYVEAGLQLRGPAADAEVLNISQSAVRSAENLLAEAWALRRLSGALGTQALPGRSDRLLQVMVRDHMRTLEEGLAEQARLLNPVLVFISHHPIPRQAESIPDSDWMGWISASFARFEQMHALTLGLFAGGDLAVSSAEAATALAAHTMALQSQLKDQEAALPQRWRRPVMAQSEQSQSK